jgi:hypothetical protein
MVHLIILIILIIVIINFGITFQFFQVDMPRSLSLINLEKTLPAYFAIKN